MEVQLRKQVDTASLYLLKYSFYRLYRLQEGVFMRIQKRKDLHNFVGWFPRCGNNFGNITPRCHNLLDKVFEKKSHQVSN